MDQGNKHHCLKPKGHTLQHMSYEQGEVLFSSAGIKMKYLLLLLRGSSTLQGNDSVLSQD